MIDKTCRKKTMTFKYPGSGHLFVFLKFQSYLQLGRSWLGAVQDCYIILVPSLNFSLRAFPSSEIRDLINESDEEGRE